MHVMSPPGFSSTCSSRGSSYSDSVPAPTACCLEISSLVPCIGFASPLLPSPPFPSPPAAVVAETAKYVQCESADVLEQLPAGSLSKLHKCQLVSSYRTLSSSLLPFLPPSPCWHWGVLACRGCAVLPLGDVPQFQVSMLKASVNVNVPHENVASMSLQHAYTQTYIHTHIHTCIFNVSV